MTYDPPRIVVSDAGRLEREISKGREAGRLLDSPLLRGFLDGRRDSLISRWRRTEMGDVEGRERAYRMMHALDALERELDTYSETGRLAEIEQEDEGNMNRSGGSE